MILALLSITLTACESTYQDFVRRKQQYCAEHWCLFPNQDNNYTAAEQAASYRAEMEQDAANARKAEQRQRLNDWLARAYRSCADAAFDRHDGSLSWYDKCANAAEDKYHTAETKAGLPYQSTESSGGGGVTEQDLLMGMMPYGPPMPGVPYGAPQ